MRVWPRGFGGTEIAIALALVAAGCGTDDDSQSGADPTTEADTSEGADDADAPAPEDPPDSADDPDASPDTESTPADLIAYGPAALVTDPLREPRSLHITWQNETDSTLTFAWATTNPDATDYVPRVWIAPEQAIDTSDPEAWVVPFEDDNVIEGAALNYVEALFGVPTSDEEFVVYTVEVTGLEPDTRYAYRVGSWDGIDPETGEFQNPNLSPVHVTSTAPAAGSREPFSLVIAGDSRGGMAEIVENMDRLADMDAATWLFTGDMTPVGTQPEWDEWFSAMQPLLARRPFMPVQGNHEIFADLYYGQWALPRAENLSEELQEHAWAITIGNLRVIGLDSNSSTLVVEQIDFLMAELEKAAGDPDIDWVISICHHAPYSSSNHGSTRRLQEHWSPLFENFGLDVSFAGHDHNYERSIPIRDGEPAEDQIGTTYIVAGAFYVEAPYSNGENWWTVTSTHGETHNYVHLTVDGPSMNMKAYAGDGVEILDEITWTKP